MEVKKYQSFPRWLPNKITPQFFKCFFSANMPNSNGSEGLSKWFGKDILNLLPGSNIPPPEISTGKVLSVEELERKQRSSWGLPGKSSDFHIFLNPYYQKIEKKIFTIELYFWFMSCASVCFYMLKMCLLVCMQLAGVRSLVLSKTKAGIFDHFINHTLNFKPMVSENDINL